MSQDSHSPNRRRFLKTSVAAAGLAGIGQVSAAGSGASGSGSGTSAATRALSGKPNILILMVDEQRYPTVYESAALKKFRTQYLKTQETLRRSGLEFHRHYAASVACVPSRTSFYTGHYPSLHGNTSTDGAAKGVHDPDMFWLDPNTVPTIGNYFHTAGYRTFYKGKWHLSHADLSVPGTRQSLASYDGNGNRDPAKEDLYLAARRLEDYGFTGWVGPEPHGNDPLNSGSSQPVGKHGRDEAFAAQTIELLQQLDAQNDATPWLIVSSFVNPHDIALWGFLNNLADRMQDNWNFSVGNEVPATVFNSALFRQSRTEKLASKPACQRSYVSTYRKFMQPTFAGKEYFRFYYQLHKNVDEQLARVYEAFKGTRFFDNTIVVFTSDHGDLLGAHGGMHQKWYTAYEEALHVPLIFSSPKLFGSAAGTDILTSHVDILPTLLGLAGLDAEALRKEMEGSFTDARPLVGKDLSALILGKAAAESLDGPVYFMTDDDPSRGLNQENFIGIDYSSVKQPNHVETVIARLSGKLWKYSRYFDNPQFWTDPGTPVKNGVRDEVVKELGNDNRPGTYPVTFQKTVKIRPAKEEWELYDLGNDPMELKNLAGNADYQEIEAQLKTLLAEQSCLKRLTPQSGAVPGQPACAA
jgi:choline-sulfatase